MLLRLAHAEPSLFSHLITLGAPPSDFSRAFYPTYLERCSRDQEMKDIAEILRLHTELVFSEPEMQELRERTIRSRLSLPRETILSFFDPDPTKDVLPLLAGISTPVLVTHGREDRVIAFAAAEEIAAQSAKCAPVRIRAEGTPSHLHGNDRVLQCCEAFRSAIARVRLRPRVELRSSHLRSSGGGAHPSTSFAGSCVRRHGTDVAFGSKASIWRCPATASGPWTRPSLTIQLSTISFKTLAEFRGDGTIAASYHFPNVARMILETFLDFHVPGTANVYSKLSTLDFDENKRTAIYKFTNDLSHRTGQGFEPGLVDDSLIMPNICLR